MLYQLSYEGQFIEFIKPWKKRNREWNYLNCGNTNEMNMWPSQLNRNLCSCDILAHKKGLVKKKMACTAYSTNHDLLTCIFPHLTRLQVYLLQVLIGSLYCLRLLCLVRAIALVLVLPHKIENSSDWSHGRKEILIESAGLHTLQFFQLQFPTLNFAAWILWKNQMKNIIRWVNNLQITFDAWDLNIVSNKIMILTFGVGDCLV